MKRKRLLGAVVMAAVLTFIPLLAAVPGVSAQECRVVKISGGGVAMEGRVAIEPDLVNIPKDTCVVWLNRVRTNEVRVKFADGKKCDDVTTAETGFDLDAAECFVTSYLPFAGTSSLNFVESGTFEYVVETSTGVTGKGKIIVE